MKFTKTLKLLCAVTALTLTIGMLSGCGSDSTDSSASTGVETKSIVYDGVVPEDGPTVKFTMEDGESFTIVCAPEYAPATVENFLTLVGDGFYDGLTFHRVLDGFVAQGGDPLGTGTGGSDKNIPGEFADNGFTDNTLPHLRGSVAMARAMDPNSATSQFYICYDEQDYLNGSYAVFGQVTEGMEVIDAFLDVPRDTQGMPETPIVIEKAEIISE